MDTGAAIALTLVGGIVLAVIVTLIIAKLKGKIDLRIENKPFHAGEAMQGTIIIHAHKHIDAEHLRVSLLCETSNEKGQQKTSATIYRENKDLFGPRPIAAGSKVETRFSFTVPMEVDVAKHMGLPALSVAGMGSMASLTPRIAGGINVWRLEVHLAAKGVDLYHRRAVTVVGAAIKG